MKRKNEMLDKNGRRFVWVCAIIAAIIVVIIFAKEIGIIDLT